MDNSKHLVKSLQVANQELEQKSKVFKSIPPDYLDALERLRSDKPCCREKTKREENLEIKYRDLEHKLKEAQFFIDALG